jgi:hypothetical protein
MIEASVFFIVLPLAEKKSNVPVRKDAKHPHRNVSRAGLPAADATHGCCRVAAPDADALAP